MTFVAFLGDIHGAWDVAVNELTKITKKFAQPAFAVAVGDSEPYRSEEDMAGSSSPPQHRTLGTYPDVVAGRLSLPCPVYFIGGNHDPYLALETEGAGTWGPNTHYLGRAGATEIHGVRVGFLSGIFSPAQYQAVGDRVAAPGRKNLKRLTYYTEGEIARLRACGKVDLLVTHDWPTGVPDARYPGDPILRSLHDDLSPSLHVAGHNHFTQRVMIGDVQFNALKKTHMGGVALYRFREGKFEFVRRNARLAE